MTSRLNLANDQEKNRRAAENFRPIGGRGPAVDEYTAIQRQIDAGHYVDPHEIWDVVQALMEEGHQGYAEKLAEHLPDD